MLIDLAEAIERAGLTAREKEAFYYVYERDMTMGDAGNGMGVGKDRISRLVSTGIERVARVFEEWNYGEITIEEAA
ncbi:sigma factor-like helix-turn-helix DNA-binding protein [Brevibacillus laterosporus]|uniref:sigma factor-like helix-turn-helix DNA-binding protein n=1 Tax=Brevibacillus laterosporus TaxID=1465 RepID=UPI003D1EF361